MSVCVLYIIIINKYAILIMPLFGTSTRRDITTILPNQNRKKEKNIEHKIWFDEGKGTIKFLIFQHTTSYEYSWMKWITRTVPYVNTFFVRYVHNTFSISVLYKCISRQKSTWRSTVVSLSADLVSIKLDKCAR